MHMMNDIYATSEREFLFFTNNNLTSTAGLARTSWIKGPGIILLGIRNVFSKDWNKIKNLNKYAANIWNPFRKEANIFLNMQHGKFRMIVNDGARHTELSGQLTVSYLLNLARCAWGSRSSSSRCCRPIRRFGLVSNLPGRLDDRCPMVFHGVAH